MANLHDNKTWEIYKLAKYQFVLEMIGLTLKFLTVLPMEAVREQQRKQQKYEKQRKMLIRRKDIMNQVNIGSLHLAEEKEKHDLEMQIENYTLGDLHRNINELTVGIA